MNRLDAFWAHMHKGQIMRRGIFVMISVIAWTEITWSREFLEANVAAGAWAQGAVTAHSLIVTGLVGFLLKLYATAGYNDKMPKVDE